MPDKVFRSWQASKPSAQFWAQVNQETRRLEATNPTMDYTGVGGIEEFVHRIVKRDWNQQGIWNIRWNDDLSNAEAWKHESFSSKPTKTVSGGNEFTFYRTETFTTFPRELIGALKPCTDEGNRVIVLEGLASTPYAQFISQVDREMKIISPYRPSRFDIHTQAYEIVKKFWTAQGIWLEVWGILPGDVWGHELPYETFRTMKLNEIGAADFKRACEHIASANQEALVQRAMERLAMGPQTSELAITDDDLLEEHSKNQQFTGERTLDQAGMDKQAGNGKPMDGTEGERPGRTLKAKPEVRDLRAAQASSATIAEGSQGQGQTSINDFNRTWGSRY